MSIEIIDLKENDQIDRGRPENEINHPALPPAAVGARGNREFVICAQNDFRTGRTQPASKGGSQVLFSLLVQNSRKFIDSRGVQLPRKNIGLLILPISDQKRKISKITSESAGSVNVSDVENRSTSDAMSFIFRSAREEETRT